jgi:FixJ family two-component response regulator
MPGQIHRMPAPVAEPTVFLLDDDHSARTSLVRLLNYAHIRAEGFSSPEALVDRLHRDATGCLILDVRLPGLNGLDFYDGLVADRRALPVVFLSGYLDVGLTVRAMRAGAIDVLQKPVVRDVLLDAVNKAFQRDQRRRADLAEEQIVRARYDSLTPRERDVMAQVMRGEATKSIASELGSSEKTIKAHRSHVMRKFGVRRTADLVRMADRLAAEDQAALLAPKTGRTEAPELETLRRTQVSVLKAHIQAGLAFVATAQGTSDAPTQARTTQLARDAYETVLRFMDELDLREDEEGQLKPGLSMLRAALSKGISDPPR